MGFESIERSKLRPWVWLWDIDVVPKTCGEELLSAETGREEEEEEEEEEDNDGDDENDEDVCDADDATSWTSKTFVEVEFVIVSLLLTWTTLTGAFSDIVFILHLSATSDIVETDGNEMHEASTGVELEADSLKYNWYTRKLMTTNPVQVAPIVYSKLLWLFSPFTSLDDDDEEDE